jgi:hypothetical protein
MIRLFPEETILSRFAHGAAVLTTHRICYHLSGDKESDYEYIMLINVNSCRSTYRRNVYSLLLSVSFAAGGLWAGLNGMLWPSVVLLALSASLAAIYFSNSRNLIVVDSPSLILEINAEDMNLAHILDCINHIEQARLSRLAHVKAYGLVVY